MRIHATQHVPAFVDTDVRNSADVTSVDELLAVPWIKQWAESWPAHEREYEIREYVDGTWVARREMRPVTAQTFHRWSVSDHRDGTRPALMAEYDGGDRFYVVAFLTSDEPIPLPEWRETETARLRREKWNRGDTS